MAYGGNNSYNQTIQFGSADYCYVIKEALLWAGWTLVASGGGTGFSYSTSVDQVPTLALWNVVGAWCRLREPLNGSNPRREYVIMRGSTATSMIIKYSRSAGFSGGAAAAGVLPTATDGVVWTGATLGGGSADANTTLPAQGATTSVASSGYISCVASNVATNGVYGFWLIAYTAGTGALATMLFTEGMSSASTPTQDQDPSIRQMANSNFWNTDRNTSMQFWNIYGLAGQSYLTTTYFGGYLPCNAAVTANTSFMWPPNTPVGLNPYDSKINVYPLPVIPPSFNPKGFTSGLGCFSVTQNQLDTFNLTSSEPRIVVAPYFCVPWIQNVVPLV